MSGRWKVEWKDESSYSRGTRGEKEPSVWQAVGAPSRISVHRHVDVDDTWFLSCHDTPSINMRELVRKDIEGAKQEALDIVYQEMKSLFNQWKKFFASIDAYS